MKCLDMKIGMKNRDGKTFWKNIGTLFVSDEVHDQAAKDKPITFVIDYPATNGIIVGRKEKEEAEPEQKKPKTKTNKTNSGIPKKPKNDTPF